MGNTFKGGKASPRYEQEIRLSAAKTQTLLLSDLEHMEAILKDPRYSFCCDFTTPRRRSRRKIAPTRKPVKAELIHEHIEG
jgi:hypothetical protein